MSDGNGLSVGVKPTMEDYDALRRGLLTDVRSSIRHRALVWILFLVQAAFVAAASQFFVSADHLPVWLAVAVCMYPASLAYSAIVRGFEPLFFRTYVDPKGIFLTGFAARIESDGLSLEGAWGRALYRWPAVLRIKETANHVFAFVDRSNAVLIPKRGFASPDDGARFAQALREKVSAEAK